MKKVITKLISCLLLCGILMPFAVTVSAASIPIDTLENQSNLNSQQIAIVDVVKNSSTQQQMESSLKKLLKTNTAKSVQNQSPATIRINNNETLFFDSNGTFAISVLQTSSSQTNYTMSLALSSSLQTINYTNTVTRYGILGNTLYTIVVTGYFTGTKGYTPTGHLVNAYYTRGTASLWQVANWEKGAYSDTGAGAAYVYGRGNFHYGLEWQGIGIIVQDTYENVYVECTKDFQIYVSR